jgi:cell division protein FtsI/penicillin-binding protein 2
MIKKETRNLLKLAMEAVVEEGLAMRLRSLKGFKTYAKTGTAQVVALDKKELLAGEQFLEHGWCVVYFTYENEDPLLLVLMVEHTGSSKVTTKIAKHFLAEYRNYRKIV